LIGFHIAKTRAEIKAFKHCIRIAKTELGALTHYYSVIKKSKRFDSKGYEAKMLYRQLAQKQELIDVFKDQIKGMEQDLENYIKDKDEYHKKLRQARAKDKTS